MKLFENIRKLISEIVGHVIEVNSIVKSIMPKLLKRIESSKEDIIKFPYTYSEDINFFNIIDFNSNIFYKIDIETRFFKEKPNKTTGKKEHVDNYVSGAFIDNKTKHHTLESESKYDIEIVLKIYNWDYETELEEKIYSVINHELHHAFDYTMRYGKKSISKILNHVKNDFKSGPTYSIKYKEYPEFKKFMEVFYLNLSEERNARIHQLYIEMLKFKDESIDDMIINMERFAPFEDFRKMDDYKNNFANVPLEIKQ